MNFLYRDTEIQRYGVDTGIQADNGIGRGDRTAAVTQPLTRTAAEPVTGGCGCRGNNIGNNNKQQKSNR